MMNKTALNIWLLAQAILAMFLLCLFTYISPGLLPMVLFAIVLVAIGGLPSLFLFRHWFKLLPKLRYKNADHFALSLAIIPMITGVNAVLFNLLIKNNPWNLLTIAPMASAFVAVLIILPSSKPNIVI